MIVLLILLLIPIFFIGLVMYSLTLYEYILNNNLDTVLLLIGLFATIISSFIMFKSLQFIEKDDYFLLRVQQRVDAIIGIISFTILLIFGVSILLNTIVHPFSYAKLLIGVFIFMIYIYGVYYYFVNKKEYICTIIDIEDFNENLYCVTIENEEIGLKEIYVKDKKPYKKNKKYKCCYNKGSKIITKILNEVIEVK